MMEGTYALAGSSIGMSTSEVYGLICAEGSFVGGGCVAGRWFAGGMYLMLDDRDAKEYEDGEEEVGAEDVVEVFTLWRLLGNT